LRTDSLNHRLAGFRHTRVQPGRRVRLPPLKWLTVACPVSYRTTGYPRSAPTRQAGAA